MEGRHSMWFPMTEVEESFRKQLTSQELTDGMLTNLRIKYEWSSGKKGQNAL
ncbi:hypothetical protein DPMN_146245 [Dreissena polymorpha]|uniref:Uncharacterized protein n=1 Tax=Dreissena polymorpha TaxID=45954 RepID=A0A9D4F9Y9_DREPO|nr:hypothetical protein DPMN_146245 [Dreissena polymorpha]